MPRTLISVCAAIGLAAGLLLPGCNAEKVLNELAQGQKKSPATETTAPAQTLPPGAAAGEASDPASNTARRRIRSATR